ncbi:hypothetical protein HA071_26235, partial [Escherichia coli]|nr:hypothetical protein [Escherichia coli]
LVEMVIAHGALGDLGIAPGHAPLITDLKPGSIRLVKQGGEQEGGGVAHGVRPSSAVSNCVQRSGAGRPRRSQLLLQGKMRLQTW